MIKVSDFIFSYLAEHVNTRHVCMLPGGGCMHLVDSLGRNKNFQHVCFLHEQAAAIAAEAYAQYAESPGLVLVTAGPGSTNAITGVAGAWIDSTPMIILSGQAKTTDMLTAHGNVRQMGIQEVDIESIVSPITKYARCVKDPEMIKYELQKALYLADNGRKGPVWLDIPLDVQGAMVDESKLRGYDVPKTDQEVSTEQINTIINILKNCERPAILAGNGIRQAGAVDDFLKLARKWQVPVMTSWKAADFMAEDDPLYVGRPGIVAQRGANFVQQTADCLIVLGSRLDLCQTGFNHPNFAPKAKKIIIDIDQKEINKLNMPLTLSVNADAAAVIRHLLDSTEELPDYGKWLSHCKKLQAKYPVILEDYCEDSDKKVNTYFLIKLLAELAESDALIVPGSSGACAEITMQAIPVKGRQRILNTPGLGAMGFGLSAAIGACLASGGKETIGIVGDGGVQMNIQELQTLKRLNLPVKLFVLNNSGYGSIYNMQKGRFDGNFVACNAASGLELPDICRLSDAYGLSSTRIKSQKDLKKQLQKVLSLAGPVICDVVVDPEVMTSPRLASEVKANGTIVSRPMEDLQPFIPADEMAENLRM